MRFNVELTVRDKGALLSVNESRYERVEDAKKRAAAVAVALAWFRGFSVTAMSSGIFVVSDDRGISVAQTRVTGGDHA